MKDIALIFPGQGAQKVGMGLEFFNMVPQSRAVFEKANDFLGFDLTDIIFSGPEEKLMSTAYCQAAIFTMSMAALEAFRCSSRNTGINVKFTAGLSLGEYTAMCAAGILSFEDSLKLIRKRGALMEEAAKLNPGKMAAVIGFDQDKLLEICGATGCEVANYNSPDQIVITGASDKILKALEALASAGCKKVFPLDVAGAFHSSLMRSAGDNFKQELKDIVFKSSDVRVISNVTGRPQESAEEIRNNLPRQIYSSVQWVDTVRFMAAEGIDTMIEIGPGRVLKGLVRKIDPSLNVLNCQVPEDIASMVL